MTTETAEVLPVEYTLDPKGVLHLISQHPDVFATLCGESIRTGKGKTPWTIGDETRSAVAATCLPCRATHTRGLRNVSLGNWNAEEGCDKCACGCKYWENDTCIDCGSAWTPETRGDD